jgi:hypothetical protein
MREKFKKYNWGDVVMSAVVLIIIKMHKGSEEEYLPRSRKQLDVFYVIKSRVHKINFLWANTQTSHL